MRWNTPILHQVKIVKKSYRIFRIMGYVLRISLTSIILTIYLHMLDVVIALKIPVHFFQVTFPMNYGSRRLIVRLHNRFRNKVAKGGYEGKNGLQIAGRMATIVTLSYFSIAIDVACLTDFLIISNGVINMKSMSKKILKTGSWIIRTI